MTTHDIKPRNQVQKAVSKASTVLSGSKGYICVKRSFLMEKLK